MLTLPTMTPASDELHFRLDEREFTRAHRLHLRHALLNSKNIGLVLIAVFLIAGQAQVLGPTRWAGPFFLALWGALLLGVIYAFVSLPGRLYRRRPDFHGEQLVILSKENLFLKLQRSEDVHEWNTFSKLRENDEFFLLYFQFSLPLVIPKRVFEAHPERVDAFRSQIHLLASSAV
ncbi:MAG: hypothetical protein A2X97_04115 [Bdellovibrionales bacterium GWA1_52_35]|nr:MAG: hypothetical protein A2X97_04115 [Bdellovibrionales bacterium GWA1_52_35]HCM38333.1 hypothetical protein [Bdellovibrionales bacterium]